MHRIGSTIHAARKWDGLVGPEGVTTKSSRSMIVEVVLDNMMGTRKLHLISTYVSYKVQDVGRQMVQIKTS